MNARKMVRIRSGFCALTLTLAVAAAAGAGAPGERRPRADLPSAEVTFADERQAMVVDKVKGGGQVTMGRFSARLTPDGEHLLYARWEPRFRSHPGVVTRKSSYRLILRRLADGAETQFAGPSIDVAAEYVAAYLAMNIFDATGRKIAENFSAWPDRLWPPRSTAGRYRRPKAPRASWPNAAAAS